MIGSALAGVALGYTRAGAVVKRALHAGDAFFGAALTECLSGDEKSELGIRLYDASPAHRGVDLFAWEPEWFARALPPAPARILVGACGGGREVVALCERGYRVDAFDPTPSLLALARARAGARYLACRFEDLAGAVLDGRPTAAAALAGERYDAALLGWNSFSHLFELATAERVTRAFDALCPRGPILISFWPTLAGSEPPRRRAVRWGAALGGAIARLRRVDTVEHRALDFMPDAGFLRRFSRDEIDGIARAVSRRVDWQASGDLNPHVTLYRL